MNNISKTKIKDLVTFSLYGKHTEEQTESDGTLELKYTISNMIPEDKQNEIVKIVSEAYQKWVHGLDDIEVTPHEK